MVVQILVGDMKGEREEVFCLGWQGRIRGHLLPQHPVMTHCCCHLENPSAASLWQA